MPLRGIEGKVAVVTGGGSGIGEGTARRLSEEGAKVVVVDWNGDAAQGVADSLPGESLAVRADVSREENVEAYMQAAVERFGRVELVHLNAGIAGTFAPFTEVTTEQFDEVIAVNLRSVFLGLRAALRQMRAQGGGGAIVTTSSLAGLFGGDSLIPYTAAKHGVLGLTKTAAMEGAKFGVRVNAVAPGMIVTGLMRPLREALGNDESVLQAIEAGIPLQRFGQPPEAGGLVTYLLSEDASFLTGVTVPLDGGSSAMSPVRPAMHPAIP